MSNQALKMHLRPTEQFASEVREMVSRNEGRVTVEMIVDGMRVGLRTRDENAAQVGWVLADWDVEQSVEAERTGPFAEQLRKALAADARDEPLRYVAPTISERIEAPALGVWRAAYLAALSGLLDPQMHAFVDGGMVSSQAKGYADRAVLDYLIMEREGLHALHQTAEQLLSTVERKPDA